MNVMRFVLICFLAVSLTDGALDKDRDADTDADTDAYTDAKDVAERTRTIYCKNPAPADLVAEPAVIPEERRIVGDCFADVNRCPAGSCVLRLRIRKIIRDRNTIIRICPVYGVTVPVTEDVVVDCGVLGERKVKRVVDCGCRRDRGIEVNVYAVDSDSGEALAGLIVKINKQRVRESETNGVYTDRISSLSERVVIRAGDKSQEYIATVKVVDIPLAFKGPINVNLLLVKIAEPTLFDSTDTQVLEVTGNSSNPDVTVAMIKIPENSFSNQDGSPYTGTVKASVNFVDVSNQENEDQIPGRFLTREDGPNTPLISDGIFALTFKDSSDNLLEAGPISVSVQEGMKLWSLANNGNWRLIETVSDERENVKRSKRQTALDDFLVTIENAQWVNIDKIPGAPQCYFKARVFEPDCTTEIETSATTSFHPRVVGFVIDEDPPQRLVMYTPSTMAPATTCYPIRCPDENDLRGFINLTSYEYVSVGGVNIPVVSSLEPKALDQYSASIQDVLSEVLYEKVPSLVDIFVKFTLNETGPFYTNLTVCEDSTIADPAFHFIKPPVPDYEPFPSDTALCTARIKLNFAGSTDFAELAMLAPPDVTAISVWETSGQDFFYTDNQVFFIVNETDYIICLSYRCSNASSPTTVYLTVNAPTTFNATTNETTPAFTCRGECDGRLCVSPNQVNGFNASIIPPPEVDDGPDYFLDVGVTSGCEEATNSTQFATTLSCTTKISGADSTGR